MRAAHLLRLALPFVISALLVFLLVRTVAGEANELLAALRSADWRLLLPAIALYFAGAWLRSARWGLLLPEHSVSTATLFRVLLVGFTVNNLLPLRMGEVARAYLLARWCSISYGSTLASLVVERILDGLTLAVLLLIALVFVPSAPSYLFAAGVLAGGGFLVGAVILGLAAWRSSAIVFLATALAGWLPKRFAALVVRLATTFGRSLSLVRGARRLASLLALSSVAWCAELGVFYVLMFSFDVRATYPLALLVGSAANFATLVPSSPGYVGTFDGVLVKVLGDTAGLTAGTAAAYALVVHATLFLPVVVVGTLVLWRSHMSFSQITHAPDRQPAASAGSDPQPAA